jgi:formylglycine-generating enzyme required for sulfatase activity
MAEMFDRSTWKSRVVAQWQEIARDLPGTMRRLGVSTAYGLLTASAWLPLLAAYADDPGQAVAALAAITGGVGTNLLSNLVQGTYDKATAPRQAEREVAEQPEVRAEYQQMLTRLDVLAAAQGALDDRWAVFEERLRGELASMGGELRIESGGGAIVLGKVRVEHGNFIGRDQIIHIHPPPPAPDTTPLREAFLRHVAGRCGRLPLRGVDLQAGDATARAERPRLAQVYIHLDTTATAPRGTAREARAGKLTEFLLADVPTEAVERVIAQQGRVSIGETETISALDAVLLERRIVLLGAPGSGKSTFVGHLAFSLAMAQLEPEGEWLGHLPGWPGAEMDTLPVVVLLRDFAHWAASQGLKRGVAQALDDFIAARLSEHVLADFAGPLREALHQGKAMALLDGLDEVPTRELRALVRDAVDDFARTYGQSRVLVTCRTFSYQDPAWQLTPDEFPVFELAPFDEEKIDRFIDAWYVELAELKAVRPEDADPLVDKLRQAVRRPDLWRLAPNPLLLTVMALVHAHKGRLPESRALLYEECTDLLLWRWEQVKWQAEKERLPGLRDLLAQVGMQDVDLKGALWELAFEAHAAIGGESDEEATAGIAEVRLLQALRELHPACSWDWASEVVAQVKERAGLLLEREPEVYTFPHRTFQEYLAGCHLSVQADFPQQAGALLTEAAFWREVVLLAVGRQVHISGEVARPLALVAELCPGEAPVDEKGWRGTWLAGEVLLEIGVERAARYGLGRDLLTRTRGRLAALVDAGYLAPRERAEAGDVLGKLSDPRPGVGIVGAHPGPLTHPTPGESGVAAGAQARTGGRVSLPDMVWVEIPPGPFLMGSREDDQEIFDDERPQHSVEIPYRYWMARYPVTVGQYACFLKAGGYVEPGWWTTAGWAWRQGEWDSQVEDKALREWLRLRPAGLRSAPMWWGGQREHPNRPVMGVSWFEAVAFGCWLTEQIHKLANQQISKPANRQGDGEGKQREHKGLSPILRFSDLEIADFVVRLPTEAEREKAARGGPPSPSEDEGVGERVKARRYPWGDEDWELQRANIEQTIGHATPVGMYPLGATPSGLLDLLGNVWEWTTSLYRPYPYRVDDGREELEAEGRRVLRGGSWYHNRRDARCAYRLRSYPGYCSNFVGFRLVVSLALPPSDS